MLQEGIINDSTVDHLDDNLVEVAEERGHPSRRYYEQQIVLLLYEWKRQQKKQSLPAG